MNPNPLYSLGHSKLNPTTRLRLREVHDRCPSITLKPKVDVVIGRFRSSRFYAKRPDGRKPLPKKVTHALHHPKIEDVECVVTVDSTGTALVHCVEEINGHTKVSAPGNPTSRGVFDSYDVVPCGPGSYELQVGDVLWFSDALTAPRFVVENDVDVHRRARDGSAASFSLLDLDHTLLLTMVLPLLPIRALARLALSNSTCAELVAQHVVRPEAWSAVSVFKALDEARTHAELMSVAVGIASSHVVLKERTLWSFYNARPASTDESAQAQPPFQDEEEPPFMGGDDTSTRVRREMAMAVATEERDQNRQLVAALAARMEPSQLVPQLTSMRTQISLDTPTGGETLELSIVTQYPTLSRSIDVFGAQSDGIFRDRLGASVLRPGFRDRVHYLPFTPGVWTPQLLVTLGKTLEVDGTQLYHMIREAKGLNGPLDDTESNDDNEEGDFEPFEASFNAVEALWMAQTTSLSETAKFLVAFHLREDPIHDLPATLAMRAVQAGGEFSVGLVAELIEALARAAEEEYRNAGEDEELPANSYLALPSEFVAGWAQTNNFPYNFSVEDVRTVVGSMSRCPSELSLYFGRQTHGWMARLLLSIGDAGEFGEEDLPDAASIVVAKVLVISAVRL